MSSTKDKEFRHNVRKYFREFSQRIGIHGFRYVTEKRSKAEKILWIIILLLSLTGCIYMIYKILEKYNRSPVVISFATHDTPVYQIPFPAITVCAESKFSHEKFNYTEVTEKIVDADDVEAVVNKDQLKTFYHLSLLCDDDPTNDKANDVVGEDFYDTIGDVKLENIIPYCILNDKTYPSKDLFTPIILDEGVCYSFNIFGRHEIFKKDVQHYLNYYEVYNDSRDYFDPETGYRKTVGINAHPRRGSISSGADNAFIVMFRSNSKDVDSVCNSFFQGFRVLIHNPWDVPRLSKHYFRIPNNKVIVAAVEPELIETSFKVRKFNPEKRQCYMRDERPLKYFQEYSQPNCLLECITNHTLRQCGCVEFYMPRHNDTRICGSGSNTCVENAEADLKVKELESKIEGHDFCDCKPSCTNLKFNVETSHSNFYFKDYFSTHFKDADIDTNYHWSILQVYFKDEQFMTKERNELYGVFDLISQLGGLLGLFMGFSLVTAVEIIYFCSLRIYYNERLYGLWSGPAN